VAGLLPLLLGYACASTPVSSKEVPEPLSAIETRINNLALSDPEAAFHELFIYPEFMDSAEIAEAATESIIQKFISAQESESWDVAERLLSSMTAISKTTVPVFKNARERIAKYTDKERLGAIYRGQAEKYKKEGLYAPAIFNYLSSRTASDSAPPAPADLGWLNFIKEVGDHETLRILDIMSGDNAQDQETYIRSAMAGVVTVYVDKGLKIEGGRGYPDRVVGSAFQIDPSGFYLTNYHVIASEVDPTYEGYSRLSIRPFLHPEARIPAKVIGWSEDLDLALIKSQEISSYTFSLSSDRIPKKGERVYALGSPVGLESSVSSGIVSASGRKILPRGEALQIDAPVNPGSSGGPLIDAKGTLVGVVFAGLSGFQGLNFAMPMPWVRSFAVRLFKGGELSLPWLGATAAKTLSGTLEVDYIFPSKTSLRLQDKIIAIDGIAVPDLDAAQKTISNKPIYSLAAVTLSRNGKLITILHRCAPQVAKPFEAAIKLDTTENLVAGLMGMSIEHINGPRGNGGTYRVAMAWPGKTADESGISVDDIIKIVRFNPDIKQGFAVLDFIQKSPVKGYLEKTIRVAIRLDSPNFL
jgi:S1-C subfamily serine protease